MSTVKLEDDTALPRSSSALGRLLLPGSRPELPPGVDFFVPADERLHDRETLRAAAFVAIWSLAATGCLLPWSGDGGWLHTLLRFVICLLGWFPIWLLALLSCFVAAAVLGGVLESFRVISAKESQTLITAIVLLALSTAACYLASSAGFISQLVGWVWLFVLGAEGLLRLLEKARQRLG